MNDGASADAGVLLMTGGLCLQGPANQGSRFEAVPGPAPLQRVQAPRPEPVEVVELPRMHKLRVVVTASNGVSQARINEIRVYDAEGLAPFPKQQQ